MPPDDLDRDKLYSASAEDDDGELQLEPLDPAEIAARERPAARVDTGADSIDIEEIYRDLEGRRDAEIMTEWLNRLRHFNFQFQLKHLLALTAAVAIVLAVSQWFGWRTLIFLAVMLTVVAITLYLNREERKRQEEAARRREKLYAERRARLRRPGQQVAEVPRETVVEPPPPDPLEEARRRFNAREFRFRFSLAQFLVAITSAAVLLGLINIMGGVLSAATIYGLIALGGLVIHALGYQPPEIVVFGWWVLLALYIVLWAGFFGL